MKLIAIVVLLFVITPCSWPQCSGKTSGKNRFVAITPSSGLGSLPDKAPFAVKEFINLKSKRDYSRLFGVDAKMGPFTVEHVPFGTYRVKIQYGSEVFGRLIDVCDQDESVEVPNHFGRVRIVLLDTTISSVKEDDASHVKVESFRNVDGTEMRSLFNGAVADGVPYGSYDLEIFHPLAGIIKRQVDVYQEEVPVFSGVLWFGLEDRDYNGPENVVFGEIENVPANERPLFVTMSGIYAPHMSNSTVSDSGDGRGTFSLNGTNPLGEYLLYTIGRSGILDAREIKLPRETKVTIDLSHPNPPKKDLQ
jgi:hypothetical protein